MSEYTYILTFENEHPGGIWRILDISSGSATEAMFDPAKWVFEYPHPPAHDDDEPPEPVRNEYERLIDWHPKDPGESPVNIVEIIADDDDCAWDQPCAYGHRVEQHAVYCHNKAWLYAPGKCRRRKDDPEYRHEDCKGFKPNPLLQRTENAGR